VKKLFYLIENIVDWSGKISSWFIVPLTFLVVLEIILRRFLNCPTIWNFEVTIQIYGFYTIIFFAYGFLHKKHVSIDILTERLHKRKKAIFEIISHIIFFYPFVLIVLMKGIPYAARSWGEFERSWSVFGAPLYMIKTVIPISFFLLLMQGIVIFVRYIFLAIKGEEL